MLRLLAADLTKREIAEALYVSFNLVKTHVKSIFRKPDVATPTPCVPLRLFKTGEVWQPQAG